jgi:thiamine kinase-like enzyme
MATDSSFGMNEQYKPLITDLCLLPCFAKRNINSVVIIDSGLSQPCFRVQVDEYEYFAKHITSGNTELLANKIATEGGVAPNVIHGEGGWLISEFLSGKLLENCQLSEDERLTVTLSLLAKCHRLLFPASNLSTKSTGTEATHAKLANAVTTHSALTIPRLAIEQTISHSFHELSSQQQNFSDQPLSLPETKSLMTIAESVLQELAQLENEVGQSKEVFCHGDANFSNVIKLENSHSINVNSRYQLIDFECACIAPIEYDIAMMMAVNEIKISKVKWVVAQYSEQQKNQQYSPCISKTDRGYQQENQPVIVDNIANTMDVLGNTATSKVTRYYYLSLIINGLWYLSQYQQRKLEKYKNLANKQFSLLVIQYPETIIVIN